MTIAEAVEIVKNPTELDPWGYEIGNAVDVIVAEYLRLTDPTPLTVELIEKELGKPQYEWCWKVGRDRIVYSKFADRVDVNGSLVITTLGDLRWIVAKMRGGGE